VVDGAPEVVGAIDVDGAEVGSEVDEGPVVAGATDVVADVVVDPATSSEPPPHEASTASVGASSHRLRPRMTTGGAYR
jgi:hypothetical protein